MKPSILLLNIITMMVFIMMNVLVFLWLMEDMNTCLLISSNLHLANRGIYHSSDDSRVGSKSQETIHSFSNKCEVYNFGVDGICGTRSQETSHSSSHNRGARVEVDGIFGCRSQISHYYSYNPGGHGILLSSLFYSCPV